MKLLAHILSTSTTIKGVKIGFPLKIEATEVKIVETDYNEEFIVRIMPRVQWPALYEAAEQVGHVGELPKEPVEEYESNPGFLREVHRVLRTVEVQEGNFICPETGRKFPITNGIARMLLTEDEVRK
jgi:multifunctional methyltransferase subunit TRM112